MDALRTIVDWIASLELAHPIRVGVDGRSAAGKTTLADVLADMVQSTLHRPVVRASIDDFHRPGHKFRSMRGEWTAQSCTPLPHATPEARKRLRGNVVR